MFLIISLPIQTCVTAMVEDFQLAGDALEPVLVGYLYVKERNKPKSFV